MPDIHCIGICTGGGDAPGLNAVIRAAVKAAILKYPWKVIGILNGFDGIIWPERSRELTLEDVSGILPRGGTILGTTNRGNPFCYKTVEDGQEVVRDISDQVIANSKKLGIDAIISIGGDGSMKIALDLFKKGMPIVGVPKTIDNDLCATEVTFGFDTALHTATDAVDKIHTTAEAHHRVMVVEVMGRDAGWIALEAGIAGGAHLILIPEIAFSIEKICQRLSARQKYGKRFTIMVVAEGIKLPEEMRHMSRTFSVGNMIGDAIAIMSRKEVRVSVLGHIQRGGSPSPYDRILGTRFGVGRGGTDRGRRLREDGVPATGVHSRGYDRGRGGKTEDGRSGRRDRARGAGDRDRLWRLKSAPSCQRTGGDARLSIGNALAL